MLSVCLWGTNTVEILDWQCGYSQTSGELDDRSWLQVFKSSEWMLAFIVIYVQLVSYMPVWLLPCFPKVSCIFVWPVLISTERFLSSAWTDFSIHISIIWKNTLSCRHIEFCHLREKMYLQCTKEHNTMNRLFIFHPISNKYSAWYLRWFLCVIFPQVNVFLWPTAQSFLKTNQIVLPHCLMFAW